MSAHTPDPAYQAFTSQAEKCEAFASANPSAYRSRVIGLAILGYVFAPALLLLLLAIFAAIVWFIVSTRHAGFGSLAAKFGFGLVLLIPMVARALWPSFGPPEGVRLRRADFPLFFAFLDDVRQKAGNPRIDRVYLVHGMNAGISQTPRLGLLGWYRNELSIGLPLMQTLAPREFAAVLAHEFGHLHGAHGRLGAWIYRSRTVMAKMLGAIERKKSVGALIFNWFYRWYAPFFAAYSFALAREQEYEADRTAAAITSPRDLVDALIRTSVGSEYLEQVFWPGVWERAQAQPTPPDRVYDELAQKLPAVCAWQGSPDTFEASLARTTDFEDTHPSLSDRATALSIAPSLPSVIGKSAASSLLDEGEDLARNLSQHWYDLVTQMWSEHRQELEQQRAQLDELDAAAATGALSEDDAMTRGLLAERFQGPEAALERYEQALIWSKEAMSPLFAKGRLLLRQSRDEGLRCLDQVMATDANAIVPGCELAAAYLMRVGRPQEAEAYIRRKQDREQILEEDFFDRSYVRRDDEFVPYDGSPEKVSDIVQILRRLKRKGLKTAWIARKNTRHQQSAALYVLVCDLIWNRRWGDDIEALQANLAAEFAHHEDLVVLVCDVRDGWLRDKARGVPHAEIFKVRRRKLAYLIAPLLLPVAVTTQAWLSGGYDAGALKSVAFFSTVFSYAGTLLLGVPSFLMLRALKLRAWWISVILGFAIGILMWWLFLATLFPQFGVSATDLLLATQGLVAAIFLGSLGSLVGLSLWLIVRPDRS